MGVSQEIICIEDLQEVYESRKEDFNILEGFNINRRVLMMHLGGIVIECFVKSIILYKFGITKRRKGVNGLWYNEESYGNILHIERTLNQVTKREYVDNGLIVFGGAKEGHDFPTLIQKHLGFDRATIQDDLDRVYNPLEKGNDCFIDLRYCDENDVEITDELYMEWKESFNNLCIWMDKQRNAMIA